MPAVDRVRGEPGSMSTARTGHIVTFTDDIGRSPRSRQSASAREVPSYLAKARQERPAGSPTKTVMFTDRDQRPQSSAHRLHRSTIVLGEGPDNFNTTNRDFMARDFEPAPVQAAQDAPAPLPMAPPERSARAVVEAQVESMINVPKATASVVDPRLSVTPREHFLRKREDALERVAKTEKTAYTGPAKRKIAARAGQDNIKHELKGESQPDPVGTNLFIPEEEAARGIRGQHHAAHHPRAPLQDKDHLHGGERPVVDPVGTRLYIPAEEVATHGRHHTSGHATGEPDHLDRMIPTEESQVLPRHRVETRATVDHLRSGIGAFEHELDAPRRDAFADQKSDHFDGGEAQFKAESEAPSKARVQPAVADHLGSSTAPIPRQSARSAGVPSGLRIERELLANLPSSPRQPSTQCPPATIHPTVIEGSLNANPVQEGGPSPYGNHYAKQKRAELYKSQIAEPSPERHLTTTTREAHQPKDPYVAKQAPSYGHRDFWSHKFELSDSRDFHGLPTTRETHSPERAHRAPKDATLESRRNQQIDEATKPNPRRFYDSNWSIQEDKNSGFEKRSHTHDNHSPAAASREVQRKVQPVPHSLGHRRFQDSNFSLGDPSSSTNHWRTSNGVTGSRSRSHFIYD